MGHTGNVVEMNGTTQCTVDLKQPHGTKRVHLTSVSAVAEDAQHDSHPKKKRRKTHAEIDAILEERSGKRRRKQYFCSWADGELGTSRKTKYPSRSKSQTLSRPRQRSWQNGSKKPNAQFSFWVPVSRRLFCQRFVERTGCGPRTHGKQSQSTLPAPNQHSLTMPWWPSKELDICTLLCVTQKYDNLSSKSGFPQSKLSELHGNIFVETCEKCGHVYHQDFEVLLHTAKDHETGRTCEPDGCNGVLKDNIVHFDEELQEKRFQQTEHCCPLKQTPIIKRQVTVLAVKWLKRLVWLCCCNVKKNRSATLHNI